MDVHATIVVDEAQLAELVQEETHPGPRGADHLGERFLTDTAESPPPLALLCQSAPATKAPAPGAFHSN